jgi:hypothetical protein
VGEHWYLRAERRAVEAETLRKPCSVGSHKPEGRIRLLKSPAVQENPGIYATKVSPRT